MAGVSPCYPGAQDPLRDERLAALAPRPRSGGLCFASAASRARGSRARAGQCTKRSRSPRGTSIRCARASPSSSGCCARSGPTSCACRKPRLSTRSSRPSCSGGTVMSTSSCTARRCTMASPSSAESSSSSRAATTGRTTARRATSAFAYRAGSGSRTSMCRPAATSPTGRSTRNSARNSISSSG